MQDAIEKVAGAPAAALDQAITLSKQVSDNIGNQREAHGRLHAPSPNSPEAAAC